MDNFYNEIEKISKENNKVAMFVDMDGTIVEYRIYSEEELKNPEGKFKEGKSLEYIIEKLNKINKLENVDIFILTLAKNSNIVEEKKTWLKKNVGFINEENWIIINKENGEYNKENHDKIKAYKMKEKLDKYDHIVFLDDDHKILKNAKEELNDKINVYHISSAII